ncbi:MAG: 50S ribosomal protein L17 [Clostridia bacterium]|nr:50S ribosomal protein L17 [Clostridia bacterium]
MAYAKLSREQGHRKMLLRNMTTSFLREERIKTTEAKAKQLKRAAERVITLGKRGDLHARRQAAAFINDKEVVKKLFDEIAPRYEERNGGYVRIIRLHPRRGDAALMVLVELV